MPETEAELRIGVRFALSADPGELFADARAVEAAGADGIWVDASDGDPYVLLAAFAAVTWRVRLVAKGAPYGSPYAVGQETCRRLARGRFVEAEELQENWIHAQFPSSRDIWRSSQCVELRRHRHKKGVAVRSCRSSHPRRDRSARARCIHNDDLLLPDRAQFFR